MNSPGKNTGVRGLSLLQGNFPTQGSNPGLPYAKMGPRNDRNSVDLTEAEGIKKKWQEYTEGLYKKDLNDPDNHDGEITHLEPDSLECEVKWALGCITMNKASGGDGIPAKLLQVHKDDDVEVLYSVCHQVWKNSAAATGLEKVSFQRRAVAKNSNYYKIVLISHTNKAILKSLQARLQLYVNEDSQKFKLDLDKGRGTRDQIATLHWIIEKRR